MVIVIIINQHLLWRREYYSTWSPNNGRTHHRSNLSCWRWLGEGLQCLDRSQPFNRFQTKEGTSSRVRSWSWEWLTTTTCNVSLTWTGTDRVQHANEVPLSSRIESGFVSQPIPLSLEIWQWLSFTVQPRVRRHPLSRRFRPMFI